MSRRIWTKSLWLSVCFGWGLAPASALACATCFGKSDSPLAQGMNMGIVSLLCIIGGVLLCIAGFFVFLARQSARVNGAAKSVVIAEQ